MAHMGNNEGNFKFGHHLQNINLYSLILTCAKALAKHKLVRENLLAFPGNKHRKKPSKMLHAANCLKSSKQKSIVPKSSFIAAERYSKVFEVTSTGRNFKKCCMLLIL